MQRNTARSVTFVGGGERGMVLAPDEAMSHKSALLIRSLVCVGAALPLSGTPRAAERLTMRIVPRVAMTPATIRIRTDVAPDVDNRAIEVATDSSNFYRSSQLPLNGDLAPRVSAFEYRDLPEGETR